MAYGLEIWDSSGNQTLRFDQRISRLYGRYSVPTIPAGGAVNVSVPGISASGFSVVRFGGGTSYYGAARPDSVSAKINTGYVRLYNGDKNESVSGIEIVVIRF